VQAPGRKSFWWDGKTDKIPAACFLLVLIVKRYLKNLFYTNQTQSPGNPITWFIFINHIETKNNRQGQKFGLILIGIITLSSLFALHRLAGQFDRF
jgi:hypothetical protein